MDNRASGKCRVSKFAVIIMALVMFSAMSIYGCITGSSVVFGTDGSGDQPNVSNISDPSSQAGTDSNATNNTGSDNTGITDSNGTSYGNNQGLNDLMNTLSADSQAVSQSPGIPNIAPAASDINGANTSGGTPNIATGSNTSGSGTDSNTPASAQTQTAQTASSAPRTGIQQPDSLVLVIIIALSVTGIAIALLIGYKRRWK